MALTLHGSCKIIFMSIGGTEARIREIDRRVTELEALLDQFRNSVAANRDGNGSYWSELQLERNTLLAERYRLNKKPA
jgi:hypothetical protein